MNPIHCPFCQNKKILEVNAGQINSNSEFTLAFYFPNHDELIYDQELKCFKCDNCKGLFYVNIKY